MKSLFTIVSLFLFTSLFAQDDPIVSTSKERSNLRLTVYNTNRALIEEEREITLPKGVHTLRFEDVSAKIEPQTLIISAKGLSILEQNYEYDLITQEKLLQKYVGKELSIVRKNSDQNSLDTLHATLLSYTNNQPIFQIEGKIVLGLPGVLLLNTLPKNLYAKPTMNWLVTSKGGKESITTSYLTRGLSWSTDYVLNINDDDTQAELIGWVTLTNTTGTHFTDAHLALLAGKVNTVSRGRSYQGAPNAYDEIVVDYMMAAPDMQEETVDEYHLYTLPRTTSIMNQQTKQIQLLMAQDITIEKSFHVLSSSYTSQNDDRITQPVEVRINFLTGKKNHIDQALPAGIIRLYKEHDGNLLFLGEDNISHTPKKEKVTLKTGEAFDLVAEKRVISSERQSRKQVTTTEITLKNRKKKNATIFYDVQTSGNWSIKSDEKYTKLSQNLVRFAVTVLADQEVTFTYTLTRTWK